MGRPSDMWAHNLLRTKHFHGVPSGNQHPYLLKSRYGKVSLINLPVVSYYEIGTALTANHAHTAMMGVYGMLAIRLLLFCLRYLTHPDQWSDRAAKLSFWSLNIGLTWMAFVNLFPLGILQLYTAVETGYWHARSVDFLLSPWING